ncbi:MAG: hypothetical protein AAGD25_26430 [Cyanobacteria bacterium P01_F01_bin.150]
MTVDIRLLDKLSYDDAEPLIDQYIGDVIQSFADSEIGQDHIKNYPVGGQWIGTFIEMGYLYGEKTLSKMTKKDAQILMEHTLPRKITLLNPSDTDGAIEELIAFWTFLKETYKFRSAGAIIKYLQSIEDKFAGWMFDPSRGGIAKSFMMKGIESGHDMTTPEGITAFQKEYNQNPKANLLSNAYPAGVSFSSGGQLFPMVAPPPELQVMFDQLGLELPEEGTMVNPMELLASLKNAVQGAGKQATVDKSPSFDDDDFRGDSTRAYILGNLENSTQELSAKETALLENQKITTTEPGTILKDFEMLLDLIGSQGISVSGKRHQLPMKALADINDRLSNPITLDLKRPQQKSYPPINGLYLLLRATGLVSIVANGKKHRLVLNDEVYSIWKTLNPTERYCTLLEAWLVRGRDEMLGEERQGLLTEGDRCFKAWDALTRQKALTFAKASDQERLVYYPGFHNLALMEMFGFISITSAKPEAGKGWKIKKVEALPTGNAMMKVYGNTLLTNDLIWAADRNVGHPYNELQSSFAPYFPEWQKALSGPGCKFRTGRHIFKVCLGKCWRKIAIDAEATLYDFRHLILDSVEFDYDHLDRFTYKNAMGCSVEVDHPQVQLEMGRQTTDNVKIGDLPINVGGTMEYLFDFGDYWTFEVQLESIESPDTEDAKSASTPKKGKTATKAAKKTSKRSKRKLQGEIIESHGKAPEQYPSYN